VIYDGNAHTATGTATGVKGETLAGLDLSGTTHTNAGSYSDTWTFTDTTGNYYSARSTVSDSIAKATPTITVTPYSVTYDGNAHTATGTAIGVKGETLAGLDLSGTTHTNAGTYTDTWTFTDVTGNYNNASSTVSDSIGKANPTVNVSGYTETYDGNAHTATGTATGVKGEILSGLNLSGTNHTNAGSYTDTWTFTVVTGNYCNATSTVSDSIAKANAAINVTSYSVTYDGNAHTATGTATGTKGESLSGLSLAGTTRTNAGTYNGDPWTFTDVRGNYNNASGSVNDSIAKAKASISIIPYSVTYDGNAHTAIGTAKGVGGALLSGLDLSGTTHTIAGTYGSDAWTFTDTTGNYNNATSTVSDSVAKATMAIIITSPLAPNPVGTAITVGATFTNSGVVGTRSASWTWGDGTADTAGTVTGPSQGTFTVAGSHTYNSAGVYTITLKVTDGDSSTRSAASANYVVVYDPSAGFVTGGGWINSPAGADVANPALTGKANFGFDAKYQKGANAPSGSTQFQFQVGNFSFQSTSYQWLVVSGALAQYKGTGTVNGVSRYGFLLTAKDGAIAGGGGVDGFRIKVTDGSGNVVYDNLLGASDQMTGGNTEPISGGSIVIHQNERVAGGAIVGGQDAPAVSIAEVQPLVSQAIANWARAGASTAELEAMRAASVRVFNLPDDLAGVEGAGVIWIDGNAAGHGWFIDATPADHREFAAVGAGGEYLALPGSPAYGRVDLLTVLEHELGHVIGLADDQGRDLMAETLPVGVRRLPGFEEFPARATTPANPIVPAPTAPPAGPTLLSTAPAAVGASAASTPGSQPTGQSQKPPSWAATRPVHPSAAASKHSVMMPAGHHEKTEHSLASARTRDRLASESTLTDLALNLLQGRRR
jgi:hypothetical protein